jgi:hypothetical protein
MLGFAALSANLRPALRLNLYIETSPSGQQTGLGPTLAKSYSIDGRGRHEFPAVIRPERGE